MAVTGSQTSKNSSSFAAEDDSALSGLEPIGLFCVTLELAAIDQARQGATRARLCSSLSTLELNADF